MRYVNYCALIATLQHKLLSSPGLVSFELIFPNTCIYIYILVYMFVGIRIHIYIYIYIYVYMVPLLERSVVFHRRRYVVGFAGCKSSFAKTTSGSKK